MAPSGSKPSRWPLVLLAITVLLIFLIIPFQSQLSSAIKDLRDKTQTASNDDFDRTRRLAQIKTTFTERRLLESLSPSDDERWEGALLPSRDGLLWVEYNETANAAWGISMFHALHCLKMLRTVIRSSPIMRGLIDGAVDDDTFGNGDEATGKFKHKEMDPVHIGHCVGYIAQHLVCAADSTIEPPRIKYSDSGEILDAGVDGEGYQHQCRDTSLLWETAVRSQKQAVKAWGWKQGDTVESIFGG